jgi:hypothetical protein
MYNCDGHYQNSYYEQLNRTSTELAAVAGESKTAMVERDDHAEAKSNTGALTNQHATPVRSGYIPGMP